MSLVSLSKVKSNLEIAVTDFNTLLEDIIADICEEAQDYMGLLYDETPDGGFTEYLDGGKSYIWLKYANISDLSIWVDSERVWLPADQYLVDPDTYFLDGERGIVRIVTGSKFTVGQKVVKASYLGGYAEDKAPARLRRALITQIGYRFRRRKDPGLSAVTYPDGSIQKMVIEEWLPEVKEVLDRCGRIAL